jgi:hypothetical protein
VTLSGDCFSSRILPVTLTVFKDKSNIMTSIELILRLSRVEVVLKMGFNTQNHSAYLFRIPGDGHNP